MTALVPAGHRAVLAVVGDFLHVREELGHEGDAERIAGEEGDGRHLAYPHVVWRAVRPEDDGHGRTTFSGRCGDGYRRSSPLSRSVMVDRARGAPTPSRGTSPQPADP